MAAITFPLWIIFAIFSPVLMLFFILGFSSAMQMQKKISEKVTVTQPLRLPS